MATSPNDLTRQQLDELDALLQKMLAVPIAPADPTPVPSVEVPELPEPVGTWRMDSPTQATRSPHLTPTATPVMAEAVPVMASPPKFAAEPVFLETRIDSRQFARPDASANMPMPRLFGPSEPQAPPPELTFVPPPIQNRSTFTPPPMQAEPVDMVTMNAMPADEVPMMQEDEMAVPLSMAAPTNASGGVPIAMWPVYGVNKVIEGVLGLFGPPGELFCMPAMKWLLGLAGIAMLLAAAAWSARGMGWITLPNM
jgi:hypothetical protein